LICGYLGSGKTTLINRLLNTPSFPKKIAVLVNDFGELNIDAELIEQRSSNDEIISLSNGCVCCKIQDDLATSLESLKSSSIDRVIIEASGVAIPSKLKKQCLIPGFALGQCAVLIDGQSFDIKKNDKYVGHLVQQQARDADLIILTKLDLAPDFKLELIRTEDTRINDPSNTKQVPSTDESLVDRLLQRSPLEIDYRDPKASDHFATRTIHQIKPIPRERLTSLIKAIPKEVERFKGFIKTTEELVQVQGTNQTYSLSSRKQSATQGLVFIYPEHFDLATKKFCDDWSPWFVTRQGHN
tara:strand:+ start:1103 stop:1999 length:897 start_codon:yes stop_codon:yes gene_type:complete